MRGSKAAGVALLMAAVASGGAAAGAMSGDGGSTGGWDCRSEHHEYAGHTTLMTGQPIVDTGIVVPGPAAGERLSVTVDYVARNVYPEQRPDYTRAQADQQHESFTLSLGGTQLGGLTPDLPDSVDEGAVSDWDSGDQTGRFSAADVLGGPLTIVHASQFGFTESPNSLEVTALRVAVERCTEVVPSTTTTIPATTTTVAPTTTESPATTTTVVVGPPTTTPADTTLPPAERETTTTHPTATTQPTTTTVVPRLPETGQASGWLVGAGGAFLLAGLGMLRVRGGTRRV